MKQETVPEYYNTKSKLKLFIGIIFLLLAILAVALVYIIPDTEKERQRLNKEETGLITSFTHEGVATFWSEDRTNIASFEIEIADTPERQRQGLMYRESMLPSQGMLFLNQTDKMQNFWMKDTYLPLDIIFINSDSTIVSIQKNTKPFSEDTISSEFPARYVLEINAGLSDKLKLSKGDRFKWKRD